MLPKSLVESIIEMIKSGMTSKEIAVDLDLPLYHIYEGLKFYGYPRRATEILKGQNKTNSCHCGAYKNKSDDECPNCYSICVAGRPLLIEDIRVVNYGQ